MKWKGRKKLLRRNKRCSSVLGRIRMNDIFSDMQARIGCQYISDLPDYKRAVWSEMRRMPTGNYPREQLEDFSRYVFGVKYSILKEVMKLLEKEQDKKK